MRMRGWQIAAYTMPANRQDLVIMRILVRHGVSRDLADLLVTDLKSCMAYFEKNPVPAVGG
jgi:glutamate decarboxylase